MDFIAFLHSPTGIAVYTALGLVGLRTALGIYAAVKDGTFVLSKVGSFLMSQVVGRVFPFATVLFFADATGILAIQTAAAAAGAAFIAEQIGAINEAISETAKADTAAKVELALDKGNPVPES